MNWVVIKYSELEICNIPAESGVYRFYAKKGRKTCELYVGRSKNLRKRITMHKRFLKTLISENDGVLFFSYNITLDYCVKEKELIEQLNPKYNFNNNINKRKARSKVGDMVFKAMDGRLQNWMAKHLGIPQDEFSKKINGRSDFTINEIKVINQRLKCNIPC